MRSTHIVYTNEDDDDEGERERDFIDSSARCQRKSIEACALMGLSGYSGVFVRYNRAWFISVNIFFEMKKKSVRSRCMRTRSGYEKDNPLEWNG